MIYGGQHYGVPEYIDEGFLYYRKDLLSQAGIRHPPRTWRELTADAKILKSHHLPYQFVWQGDNYEGLTCVWYEFMADAFGRNLPSDVGKPDGTTPNLATALDSRQAQNALNYLRGLIKDGISPLDVTTLQEPGTDSAFGSGQAAFMRGWDSAYANVTSSGKLKAKQVGVEVPPTFAGSPGHGWSTLGGWGLFVNPHSGNQRAAFTFIKWLAGPQAQRIIATEFSQIPANASIRDDPGVTAHNPVLEAAASTWIVARPATQAYPTTTQTISSNIHAALTSQAPGQQDACTALLQAARELDPQVAGPLNCRLPGSG
jgi:multiple sugar transport system substrate-binding protein